jgi:hypothetical protein
MNATLKLQIALTALLITGISVSVLAPAHAAEDLVKVTADNYVRAETDVQMKGYVETMDCLGKFNHNRKPYDVNNQVTVRGNRDTIYSFAVFDLTSPLTITMPEPEGRYQSLMLLNQDHSIPPAIFGPTKKTFTVKSVGSRYAVLAVRTFADPNDPADMKAAHALQDAVKVDQTDIGKLELPNWDKQGVETLREALNVLNATMTDTSGYFGEKDKLDPIHHLLGTAFGWGGLPKEAAIYVNVYPEMNDGKTPYTLTVKDDVPVDGFWSVTLYDKESRMPINELNAYSFNDVTAKKADDGSITIHFGGDPKAGNYLPIVEGWNYLVRFYQPKKEILDGSWTFPAAKAAE